MMSLRRRVAILDLALARRLAFVALLATIPGP
jgi:hypothetical protein